MLLLEEFNTDPHFCSWFLAVAFPHKEQSRCIGAWHSVSDPELGESDLIVLFENRFAILIENKINAPVQSRQADRYIERGKKGIKDDLWEDFGTCIVAPAQYLEDKKDFQVLDSMQSYEDLAQWFSKKASTDPRASYKQSLLMEAIEQKRRGYTPETDENVTEFWNRYWMYCDENHPELEMKKPGQKPKGSDWPVFKPASLLKHLPQSRIIHKLAEGFIDLEIPEEFVLSGVVSEMILSLSATVENTGKSRAIRLLSAPINRSVSFDIQQDKVVECLLLVKRLLAFSQEISTE
jgi:hypothetical protein